MNPLAATLQSLCSDLRARDPQPFAVPRLTQAVASLGDGAVAEPAPPDARLASLSAKVSHQLASGTQRVSLSASEWLDAPWIALHPWNGNPICAVPPFIDGLRQAALASVRVARRCIHIFLRDYDLFAPAVITPLLTVILPALRESHGSLDGWAQRHARLRLFDADSGPDNVLTGLLSNNEDPTPLLRRLVEVGLTGSLAHGGFSSAILIAWCKRAHERAWEKQSLIGKWMEMCAGVMAGREHKVVESLLTPWREIDPDTNWRTSLLLWLQQRYGDPREPMIGGIWPQVDSGLRDVAVRWLTLQTIEGFFDLLDKYARRHGDEAMRAQWPYRRAFWLAYYRRGVLLDAKAVIGRDMEENFSWRELTALFGNRVSRLSAPSAKMSAILFRIRGLVLFVGTHQASCRVWDEANPCAPDLRRASFKYSDIVSMPRTDLQINSSGDTGIQHSAAESGGWQCKVRDFLYRKTGVFIPDNELMP